MSQLIDTLFNEEVAPAVAAALPDTPPSAAPAPPTSPIRNQRPIASVQINRTPPVLQHRPLPTLTLAHSKVPVPVPGVPTGSAMRPPPSLQHMGSPKQTTSVNVKTEPTNQIPQTDGTGDTDEDDDDVVDDDGALLTDDEEGPGGKKQKRKYTKQKPVAIEDVFAQVESLYIRRGRARPDHNDQGTCFLVWTLFDNFRLF